MQLVVVELCASRIVLLPAAAGPFPADAPIINAIRRISEPRTFPSLLRVQGSITDLSRRRNAPSCTPGIAVRRNRETAASLTRRRSRQFRQGLALCREDV